MAEKKKSKKGCIVSLVMTALGCLFMGFMDHSVCFIFADVRCRMYLFFGAVFRAGELS